MTCTRLNNKCIMNILQFTKEGERWPIMDKVSASQPRGFELHTILHVIPALFGSTKRSRE